MKCKCGEAEFDETVMHIKTYLINGSVEEHGREYCATSGPKFFTSPVINPETRCGKIDVYDRRRFCYLPENHEGLCATKNGKVVTPTGKEQRQ